MDWLMLFASSVAVELRWEVSAAPTMVVDSAIEVAKDMTNTCYVRLRAWHGGICSKRLEDGFDDC